MSKTRLQRKKEATLPARFSPFFWTDVDARTCIAKEIRRRYLELKADAGADSYQKDLLAQRAVFIGVQLESMECQCADDGKFDPGVYTQMTNTLLGLLRALGLNRSNKTGLTLDSYVEGKAKR